MFLLGSFNILMFGFLLMNLFFLIVLMKDIRGIDRGKCTNCECCEFIGKARCDCDCVALRHIRKADEETVPVDSKRKKTMVPSL